jgi:flagellar hook-length control protein FliK
LLCTGDGQLYAIPMTSTAAISSQNRLAQSASGRPDSDPAQSQDFVAALNRLAYASLSAAAVPFDTTIPDTTAPDTSRTAPDGDTDPAPEQADRAAGRAREPKDREPKDNDIAAGTPEGRPVHDEALSADRAPEAGTDQKAAEHPVADTPNEASPPPDAAKEAVEAVAASQPTPFEQRGLQTTTAKQTAQQPAANTPQAQTAQPADSAAPETKQPGTQAPGRSANADQTQITAQVTDGGDGDRLPQIGHTLSSRSALVAQSDPARTGAPTDAAAKNTPSDATAASLLTGAAQPNGQAAKAKGQAKAGNGTAAANAAANGAQNGGASANQAAAANAQPAALSQQQQQQLAATTAGTGEDGLTTGTSQTGSARTEPFTLAGPETTSQFGARGTASTQAAKPPTPVPARFITNQVAVQIQKAFGDGGDRISIQLRPAELGRVEVRLDVGKEGRVSAVITADRSDTLDLLQRDARILQHALQDAGLQADSNSLSFELKNQEQAFTPSSGGSGGGTSDSGDGGLPGASEAAATFARPNIIAQDRIDIRV